MKNKVIAYSTVAAIVCLFLALEMPPRINAMAQTLGGSGTISTLDVWTSTSSPMSAITQRTYGKSVLISGLSTGLCLTLDSNGRITTTSCGSSFSTSTNPFMATYFVATSTAVASQFPFASTTAITAVTGYFTNLLGSFITAIVNGGTATTTQVTDGVNFFDGTRITSGTALTFDGSTLTNSGTITGNKFAATSGTATSTFGDFTGTNAALGGFLNLTNGATAFITSITSPVLYGTAATGSAYPFLTAGNLVIQSRPSGAARDIVFVTGTSQSMREIITGTGNIGVGSTTPWGQLSASSTATFPTLAIAQNSTGAAAIFMGGNVGLGTTTPGSLFSLNGIANFHTATSTFYSTGGISLTSGCFAISGACLNIPSYPLSIANGGTATTTQVTNGVNYFDGTRISSSNQLTFNGSTLSFASAFLTDVASLISTPVVTLNGALGAVENFSPTMTQNAASGGVVNFRAVPALIPTQNFSGTFTNLNNNPVVGDTNANAFNLTSNVIGQGVNLVMNSGYSGTITRYFGVKLSDVNNIGTGVLTGQAGFNVADLSGATNNTSVLLGLTTIPAGGYGIYEDTAYQNFFVATTTVADISADKLVLKSQRAAIVSGNILGGLAFWSDDTNLTAPGLPVASIQALANVTHTGSALGTDLIFNSTTGTTFAELMRLTGGGTLGIGTSTPWGFFNVQSKANGSQLPIFVIASSTKTATTTAFMVTSGGHIIASSTSPTLSSCGTSPTMNGSDTWGTITVGATGGGCTITFQIAYAYDPTCVVTAQTGSVVNTFSYTHSTTGLTITQTGLGGGKVDYHCFGKTSPSGGFATPQIE
jgi:hypothetical protein